MTTDPRMTAILEDLAAGRMDAAEAARRIDALKAEQQQPEAPREPSNEELAADTSAASDASTGSNIPSVDGLPGSGPPPLRTSRQMTECSEPTTPQQRSPGTWCTT